MKINIKHLLFAIFSVGILLIAPGMQAQDTPLGDTWHIISENNLNGSIVVELEYRGELSYRDPDGNWERIVFVEDDNDDAYQDNDDESVEILWTSYTKSYEEFYVAWRPKQKELYNRDIQLRYDDEDHDETSYATVRAWKPGRINNLSATVMKRCNEVHLKWERKPDNVPDLLHDKGDLLWENIPDYIYYELYRDSTHIATLNRNDTTFVDTGVEPGEEYYYEVQYNITGGLYHPNPWDSDYSDDEMDDEGQEPDWEFNEGLKTYPVVGMPKKRLSKPSQVIATEPFCGDVTELSWYAQEDTTNDNTIDHYLVQRATDKKFNNNLTEITVNQDSTAVENYHDKVPQKNTTYYYRIKTVNACQNASAEWSDVVQSKALKKPGAPSNLQAVAKPEGVELSWKDNAESETEYVIQRAPDNLRFTTDSGETSFVDSRISACTEYTYTLTANNTCGSSNAVETSITVEPNVNTLFNPGTFQVSRGYYPDKVVLSWEITNTLVDNYKIYRREAGSGSDFKPIATVSAVKNNFTDRNAAAGQLYEYAIDAVVDCEGDEVTSGKTTRTGFRVKAGTVSGKVRFEDGSGVKHAEVLIEPQETDVQDALQARRKALYFNGTAYGRVPYSTKLAFNEGFTMQAWIKTDTIAPNQPVLHKGDAAGAYGISLKNEDATLWLKQGGDTLHATATGAISKDTYIHLAGTFDGKQLKLYINGQPEATTDAEVSFEPVTTPLFLATNNDQSAHFKGAIDEALVWNTARSEEILKLDYNRILSGREPGISAYWRMDINQGDQLFDYSRGSEGFNKNHGELHNVQWTDDAPNTSQLVLKGLTDANGKYIFTHIQYPEVGASFTFTPAKGQHTFEPGEESFRTKFVGEESYFNTLDFTDISAVKVTGSVQYKDSRCMANGIGLYIDGEPVMQNGKQLTTDKNGEFQMLVPSKGEHQISVHKKGHQFAPGVWPTDSATVFNEPVSGIEFMDTTQIRVVGRVVGGLREANKKPALGKSINNIGKARIIFRSQLGYGCSTDTAFTDPQTGEYAIDLLPINYIIKDVTVLNNLAIDFGTQEIMNLKNYMPGQTVTGSVAEGQDTVQKSATFHKRRDFIYRAKPNVQVTNETGDPFIGEESLEVQDKEGNPVEIPLTPDVTGFSVFFAGQEYTARIFVNEKYVNADNGNIDRVPLKNATIRINNDMELRNEETDYTKTITLENEQDGDTLYSFTAGNPNFLTNSTYPAYNYTKTFKIEAEVDEVSTAWHPGNAGEGDLFYRGYVLGDKSSSNRDYVTGEVEGGAPPLTVGGSTGNLPQLTTILRDPPGDGSSTFLEKGATFTTTSTVSQAWNVGGSIKIDTDLGPDTEITIPFGPTVSIKTETGLDITLESSYHNADATSTSTSYEINESISTSGAPERVGAAEDLFIGSAHNYFFGKTKSLTLVEDSLCMQSGGHLMCADSTIEVNDHALRIGSKDTYKLIDSIQSMFAYSQDHIANYLIPSLEKKRNSLFNNPEAYVSNVAADHPNFGTNNDNPVWGDKATSSSTLYNAGDSDGPSYTFKASGVDSVRWYNQIIRSWKSLLEYNENEKKRAKFNQNISFEGGGSEYEHSYEIENGKSVTYTEGFEIQTTAEIELKIKIGGLGFNLGIEATGGYEKEWEEGEEESSSVSYGYSLSDDDQGDYFSVDIMEPRTIDALQNNTQSTLTGPIFKTQGGRSLCPWEGPVTTQYSEPEGVVLSHGTMQREKPQLNVTPNIQNNVPPDQPAVYELTLGNASETDETMWYNIRLAEDSNPHGAQVKLDGHKLGGEFEIPGGESFQKTITLSPTPGVYNYKDIQILLYSGCEWDYHTNGGAFHAVDTVSISAQFIPSCSNIAYLEPNNQWVANSTNNDTLWTVLGEYNKNFPNFKKFQVQYKHVSQPDWNALTTYWNDTTGLNDTTLQMIPKQQGYTTYPWDISQVPDGEYELRAVSFCPLSKNYTRELRGIIDRIHPHAYGSPKPADGILSPDDDVYITFNEPLHGGKLNKLNMDVRGVLNGADLVHDASVNFDGQNDQVDVPAGLAISTDQPFSIEMWVKRNARGAETLLSQNNGSNDNFSLGFDAANRFIAQLGEDTVRASARSTDGLWHHYAVTYKPANKSVTLYIDGNAVNNKQLEGVSYRNAAAILLGRGAEGQENWFNGNIHELRLWHVTRSRPKLVNQMNRQLNGMEYGLIGYWPMDDAFGPIAKEKVHHRHAKIHATWDVYPSGQAYAFNDEASYLTVKKSGILFTEKTDFSLSFWFKSDNGQNVAFISNGRGDTTGMNTEGWTIHTNSTGQILVENNGHTFKAVKTNYFDNNWHQFSLVVSRYGNTHAYIDGALQNTTNSENWSGFGGPKLWIGARGTHKNNGVELDQFYNGLMDEIRFWYTTRNFEQVNRDMTHKLAGGEIGLMAYYPFEQYEEDAGVNVLRPSLKDQTDTTVVDRFNLHAASDTSFSNITPNIKLHRPVEKVNYNYSFKEDEIMFCIGEADCPGESNISADELRRIENTTLDVTVKDVFDLNGNQMISPETWTVHVDQVPVKWRNDHKELQKDLNAPMTFEATITNESGEAQRYSIKNLPEWLSVSQDFGRLAPQTSKTLTFEVHEGLNIGQYSHQVYVYNEAYDFNEKLLITLDVQATGPDWQVPEQDYQYSMNITGQLAIDSVISSDARDKVAAFVDGECRGVGNVEYVESYDLYEVFLDVYSPVKYEEKVKLRVWDASKNQIHADVTPRVAFNADKVLGSASNPRMIYATNTIIRNVPVQEGWNWLSFNLNSPDLVDPDSLLADMDFLVGNQLKGQIYYDQFDQSGEWKGSLSNSGGVQNEAMYMLKSPYADTITYSGINIDPANYPIQLGEGWNWIGYTSNQNLEVNDALSNYHPTENDVIKSQTAFAMYDAQMGWLGSLDYLAPNKGYMLYVQAPDKLYFPATGLFSVPESKKDAGSKTPPDAQIWESDPAAYQHSMSIVAKVEGTEGTMPDIADYLGVFSGGACVGVARAKKLKNSNEPMYFLTAYHNEPTAPISFRFYDYTSSEVLAVQDTLKFALNAVKGTPEKPLALKLGGVLKHVAPVKKATEVYPNPFNEEVQIRYHLPEASEVQIRIMSVTGQLKYSFKTSSNQPGWHKHTWQGAGNNGSGLPAGTYFVKIKTADYTQVYRIVKSSR